MNVAKYNLETRNMPDRPSMLADIQKRVIKMFVKKSNLTPRDISAFKMYLYGNSYLFTTDAAKYKDVDSIYPYYDSMTANIVSLDQEVTKSR